MIGIFAVLVVLLASQPAGATQHRFVAGSPEPDGAPSFSPDGQEIAFSSSMGGDWEIYLVGAWGGEVTNFTNSPGIDIYANWSPAGSWISYSSRRDNGQGLDDRDIWVQSTEGDSLRCLTTWTGDDNYSAIDPGGQWVAFTSDRSGEYEIWLMPLDGSAPPTPLSSGLEDCFHACWSPDGVWVAFDGQDPDNPGPTRLYRVKVADGTLEEIPTGFTANSDPGWSPDGRYLAFAGNNHVTDWDLWAWDFQESALIQLTDTRVIEQSPLWNAAGTEIVYARVQDNNKDIWVAYDLPIGTAVKRSSVSAIKSLFR